MSLTDSSSPRVGMEADHVGRDFFDVEAPDYGFDEIQGKSDRDRIATRKEVIRRLEQLMLAVTISENAEVLKSVREKSIEYARELRSKGEWDTREYGQRLQKILLATQSKLKDLRSKDAALLLEAPELTRMLRNDPHLHTCNVKSCVRMSMGWLCIFVFCHIPWIIAIFIVGVEYRTDNQRNPFNDTMDFGNETSRIDACTSVASFLLGFFIIYVVNILLAFMTAIARNVDDGNNGCARHSSKFIAFISVVMLAYNIYGVIVVWNETLWEDDMGASCTSMRILCVAVLSFFFILPILCFGLIRLRSSFREPPKDVGSKASDEDELEEISAKSSRIGVTQ